MAEIDGFACVLSEAKVRMPQRSAVFGLDGMWAPLYQFYIRSDSFLSWMLLLGVQEKCAVRVAVGFGLDASGWHDLHLFFQWSLVELRALVCPSPSCLLAKAVWCTF